MMSDSDRRFEITGTQVAASVLAAITGAILASYLGVGGTIIGTAVVSVVSTVGAAVYKTYLGRTARRLKERAPDIAHRAAERMSAVSTRGGTQQGQASQTRAGQTRADQTHAGRTRADQTRAGRTRAGQTPADQTHAGQTRADQTQADQIHAGQIHAGPADDQATQMLHLGGGPPTPAGGRQPGRPKRTGWLRRQPAWVLAALATVGIFLSAVAGVSVVELAAGKPLDALVWHHKGTGTSVGGLVGGQSSQTKPTPATHTAKPTPATTSPSTTPTSPSVSPSVTPTSASPTPTTTSPPVSTSPTSTSSAGATPTS
jgi:hypothetical protein